MSIPTWQALNKASLLLCFLGLAIAFFLSQEQQSLMDTDATTAVSTVAPFHSEFSANLDVFEAVYLDDRNTTFYGFQPIAIVHSLPQALFAWGFLLLSMQCFWMTFADLSLPLILATSLPAAVMLVVACVGIWRVVHPRQKVFNDPVLPAPIPLGPLHYTRKWTPRPQF